MRMEKRVLTTVLSFLLCLGGWAAAYRTISSVETVVIETPVSHAPRLPYQLWVRYADGGGEYRQVKWLNASEANEQAEANPDIDERNLLCLQSGQADEGPELF